MGLLRASVSVPESAGAAYSVVVLAGEVDATNSDELYGVLESVVTQQPRLLIVDMSELSFMDSTGLRVLIVAGALCEETGHELRIIPGEDIQRILEISGLDRVLPFTSG